MTPEQREAHERLKRIPPLSELEGEKTDEKLGEPA